MKTSKRIEKKILPKHLQTSRKRDAYISLLGEGDAVSTFGSWWDGGSRSEFCLIHLATGTKRSLSYSSSPPEYGGEVKSLRPERGWAILTTGVFCGKESTPSLSILLEDLPALLGVKNCPLIGAEPAILHDWLLEAGLADKAALVRTWAL
jgi:hypothetical protein